MSSKKTSLYESHLELNARMVDFAGWLMPIQYENLKQEVLAVRQSVGVFDVSHMGEFFITGKEAIDFAHYLVTNDIKNAPLHKAIYSPMCREDGSIIDDLIVYKISSEQIMICVNAANIEKDFEWIESQIDQFECHLADRSQDFSLLAIQGPHAFEKIQELDLEFQINDIDYYSLQIPNHSSGTIIIARTGYTGEDGFEIFGPHDFIQNIWKQLVSNGVTPCGLGARNVLRLEVCYPLYGNELTDMTTPLETGLKWTVKMNKSDFVGKTYLSSFSQKHKLVKLSLEKGIPREKHLVETSQGEQIGVITSGSMSVMLNKGIALAQVDKNLFDKHEELFVNIRGKQYPATIHTKPFVTGGHK